MLGGAVALALAARRDRARTTRRFPFGELPLHVLLVQNWGFTDRAGVERSGLVDQLRTRRLSALPAARRWRSTGGACRAGWSLSDRRRRSCVLLARSRWRASRRSATTSRASAWSAAWPNSPRAARSARCGCAGSASPALPAIARVRASRCRARGLGDRRCPRRCRPRRASPALLLGARADLGPARQPARLRRRSIISARSATRPISHFLLWVVFKLAFVDDAHAVPPSLIALYLALVLAARSRCTIWSSGRRSAGSTRLSDSPRRPLHRELGARLALPPARR